MRYYDLDVNGQYSSSYSRPQPGKDLLRLPDKPSEHHRWNGSRWVEDNKLKKIEEDRERMKQLRFEIEEGLIEGNDVSLKQEEYRQIKRNIK